MKVVFHERFYDVYTGDPAAAAGRLEPSVKILKKKYELIKAQNAKVADVERVHDRAHIEDVKRFDKIYSMALLAAGGTIQAARLACQGEPAYALVRPPGHHASPGSCWGFCFFNNVAVAVATLLGEGIINSALILDIDLHHGDGTDNYFCTRDEVEYLHPEGPTNSDWLRTCKKQLDQAKPADLIAVSAGFDRHAEDWGELLMTPDYRAIGNWVKLWSDKHCQGKRFVVLEGGYNHVSIAEGAEALLGAME